MPIPEITSDAACLVDRTTLFGLTVTVPPHHTAEALIRRLPRSLWLGPLADEHAYLVALDARVLPLMRRLYKAPDITFTPAAIDALRALSAPRTDRRSRVEITPQVCASARGLAATLDPSSAGGTGAGNPGEATARSSSPETKVAPG